ncbi:hypothetical protein M513_13029 [Trichuris suis]|uniref:Uncharacterized protein n=1 Tax=Trichuris suis TaxID=68888 RepID=A0A085LM99_9BILA|nr:hypothetical protein M513_13029 [Trichuris suis]
MKDGLAPPYRFSNAPVHQCCLGVKDCAERHRFRRRRQLPSESTDRLFAELRELITFCELGALEEQMIRDQVTEGTNSAALRERLLTEDALTLEKDY